MSRNASSWLFAGLPIQKLPMLYTQSNRFAECQVARKCAAVLVLSIEGFCETTHLPVLFGRQAGNPSILAFYELKSKPSVSISVPLVNQKRKRKAGLKLILKSGSQLTVAHATPHSLLGICILSCDI
jgi:hypothetical protein